MITARDQLITIRHKGSALIVSLMILLVMTIVGVTSLNSTMMQEKMAANNHDMVSTFQAAEAGIGQGIADAMPVDAKYFTNALDAYQKNGTPPTNNYDLDGGTTKASVQLKNLGQMHQINSSLGIFIGYNMQFTSTGTLKPTNAKSVNVQGAIKGPYPAH